MKTSFAALIALISPLILAGALMADGVVRDGLGAISIGRGGTNIAFSDNGAIVLENPAGMVNIARFGLSEVSADVLVTDLRYSDPQNDAGAANNPYPLPYISVIRKSADQNWAWGIGAFAPAGFGAEYDMINTTADPPTTQFHYKSFGALSKIMPAVAYRVSDRLAVGANLGVATSHTELEGPFYLQQALMPGLGSNLDLQTTGAAVAWGVGLQYQLSDRTTLGLNYTEETRMKLDGSAVVRSAIFPVPVTFDADLRITWPRSLGLGLAHSPTPYHRVSADVIWFDWSGAFDEIEITLTNPAIQIRDMFPLHWRDSISVRLGYEQLVGLDQAFRFGYVYHRNPVPDATLTPYIPAILEHAFSVGYEHQLGRTLVNLAYQYSFGTPQSVNTSALLGGDFDNSRMEAQAHWMSISLIQEW